jgi:hypothetical protein
MKPRRPKEDRKTGQRHPRIHTWAQGRSDARVRQLAELKKIRIHHHGRQP